MPNWPYSCAAPCLVYQRTGARAIDWFINGPEHGPTICGRPPNASPTSGANVLQAVVVELNRWRGRWSVRFCGSCKGSRFSRWSGRWGGGFCGSCKGSCLDGFMTSNCRRLAKTTNVSAANCRRLAKTTHVNANPTSHANPTSQSRWSGQSRWSDRWRLVASRPAAGFHCVSQWLRHSAGGVPKTVPTLAF